RDPDIRMRLAELYFTGSAYKEAIEEFNEVIKLAPEKDIAEEAKKKLKEVEIRLAARGDFEEAAKALREERLDDALATTQKILEREPRNSFVYFNLGVIYNRKKMYEEAVTALKKAIEISPKYVEAIYQLGVVYDDQGRFNEAMTEYEAAVAVGREDVEETKKSVERLKFLKELVVEKEVLGRVRLLTEAGDLDGALREAEKVMAVREDEEILFPVGKIYVLRKEFDKAVDILNRVIKLNPQNWEAYLFLAQGYAGKKLYNEARISYSKVVSNVPETETGKKARALLKELEVKIHFEKAGELKSKGDVEGALRETEAILGMTTDDHIALYNAGVLYYMLEKSEKAEEVLRRSVEKSPGYVPAHLQIALVYESLGRYEEANAEFIKVLSLAKEGREVDVAKSRLGLIKGEAAFSARLKKAYQLIQAGKYELALDEAKTVVTIAPDNYVAHYTVGFIYDRLNKIDEARAAFLKSLEINPDYAKSHFGLARVYEREG
ncbi:MAG: tetratricopeptide repeat protein, partial [Nitrospirota bacterium]|nr:tetratricopeptide repeat protein [Nitrospirota bacterium]